LLLLLLLVHADVRVFLVVTEKVNFEVSLSAESVSTDIAFVWSLAYNATFYSHNIYISLFEAKHMSQNYYKCLL